jgi:hypothetical protein
MESIDAYLRSFEHLRPQKISKELAPITPYNSAFSLWGERQNGSPWGHQSHPCQGKDVWLGMAQIGLICLLLFAIFTEQETNEHVQFLHEKTLAINISHGV